MSRRGVGWLVSAVVVGGLVVGGFAADAHARSEMERIARQVIANALDLDSPDEVEAEVQGGSALMQLALGTVEHVRAHVPGVEVGDARGDFHIDLYGLPTNEIDTVDRVTASLTFSGDELVDFAQQFSSGPISSVDLLPPNVRVHTVAQVDGTAVPMLVDVEPQVTDGDIGLTISSIVIGGATLTPEQLQERLGTDAASLLNVSGVCLEEAVPDSVTIDDVRVSAGQVSVIFGARGLSVLELQAERGVCR